MRWLVLAVVFVLGVGIGAAWSEGGSAETPQSCIEALNIAGEGFERAGNMMRSAAANPARFPEEAEVYQAWAESVAPDLSAANDECRSAA